MSHVDVMDGEVELQANNLRVAAFQELLVLEEVNVVYCIIIVIMQLYQQAMPIGEKKR